MGCVCKRVFFIICLHEKLYSSSIIWFLFFCIHVNHLNIMWCFFFFISVYMHCCCFVFNATLVPSISHVLLGECILKWRRSIWVFFSLAVFVCAMNPFMLRFLSSVVYVAVVFFICFCFNITFCPQVSYKRIYTHSVYFLIYSIDDAYHCINSPKWWIRRDEEKKMTKKIK